MSPHDMGPEKADCTVHDENAVGVDEALAQSSDMEKTRALRKMDWTLIPL